MMARVLFSIVAAGLVVAYVAPVAWKLGDLALGAVIAVGLVLMAVDLWQSVRRRGD